MKLVAQYKKILMNAPGIRIFEISNDIAEGAARLRARYGLRTPDALQIATALEYQADFFLTSDHRLTAIKEIKAITLLDL